MHTHLKYFFLLPVFYSTLVYPCSNKCTSQIIKWYRPLYLFATVENTPLSPDKPVRDCREVIATMRRATSLLDRLMLEHKNLANYIEYYSRSNSETLKRILPEVNRRKLLLLALQKEAEKAYPKDLTEKDRVRTLSWNLVHKNFPSISLYTTSKLEWGHFIVTQGESPPLENSCRPEERPVLKEFLPGTAISGTQAENPNEGIQWQGPGPIQITETLSPSEACMSQYNIVGSLLLDLRHDRMVRGQPETYRFYAQGPVILYYGIYSPR